MPIKKLLILFLALSPLCSFAGVLRCGNGTDIRSLQSGIHQVPAGDTLLIAPGTYKQGNLFIRKSLTLLAEGKVVLDGEMKDEIITVFSPHVRIKGFTIINSGNLSTKDLAGIKVLATRDVFIENNTLYKCTFGIYLSNTRNCYIRHNKISGDALADQSIGNGIHVWKADSAIIENNESTGQRDGIYFEFVTNSQIRNNQSHHNFRYGLHFMFSHSNTYTSNEFRENGAGVAVMYSHHVKMHNNVFDHNWGPSSYGILLKDITDSEVLDNRFENNSAGIYMEGSNRIKMERNDFLNNGWALRIQASCTDNVVSHNNFSGNTFDVSTNGETQLNSFNHNYWDKYEGYDLNKDGKGDIPYRPVSLFSMIVEQLPPGLLLLRSFMVYLLDKAEKIIPSLTPTNLMDEQPAMKFIPHPSGVSAFSTLDRIKNNLTINT
ncbi:MAG: nitrous oxide reductase family maturation protein NosD [Bacteroidia bacterium]|nr:nitrous oxide reductase family maturation protein NosD [Bacteroidia bacterium]